MITSGGIWIPDMFDKQIRVFNSYARVLLVHGPRYSGKTSSSCQRVIRHMWETPDALVGMYTKILKGGVDGGTWSLLLRLLEEWIKAKVGLKFISAVKGVPGPKLGGVTRTPGFKISNMHGGVSELMLFSLDNDDEVEVKMKDKEFSLIYISELDKFNDPRILSVALPNLRMRHLTYEQQMWIADCNPSEEGEQSWIYQTLVVGKTRSYDDYAAYQNANELAVVEQSKWESYYSGVEVIQILPSENPYADPRVLRDIEISCGSDQGLYARHVLGEWVWGGGDRSRHFRSIFNPKDPKVVIGNWEEHTPEDQREYLNPTADCHEIITGWDPGDTNHAVIAMEKVFVADKNGVSRSHYNLIEEHVSLKEEIGIEEWAEAAWAKFARLEEVSGATYNFDEHAWSDNSAWRFNATGKTYPYMLINAATGHRVNLQEVHKAFGSVLVRINLFKQLLRQGRIHVSAHLFYTIRMIKDLKKGVGRHPIPEEDKNGHIFSAITYALIKEEENEDMHRINVTASKRPTLSLSVR